MTNLTPENYYEDKSCISNSQLKDFVSYDMYGNRKLTPDDYVAIHELGEKKTFPSEDIIQVGKIVDEYFEKGPSILDNYEVVSRRNGDENQITKGMKESIDSMIEKGLNFQRFMNFLRKDGTRSQVILTGTITTPDGEVIDIKGKPDFINNITKQIVDLKTTSSIQNAEKDIFYFNKDGHRVINIRAGYVRQLAFYNYMAGGDFEGILAFLTPTKREWIRISNKALSKAWEQIEKDILELKQFINTKEYPDDILDIDETNESQDLI